MPVLTSGLDPAMEHSVRAPRDGILARLAVAAGDTVTTGDVLAVLDGE